MNNMKNTENAHDPVLALYAEAIDLGLSLETGQPAAEIREEKWLCISYPVTLKRGGSVIHPSRYSIGSGHVPPIKKSKRDQTQLSGFTGGSGVFWTIQRKGWRIIPNMSCEEDREEGLAMMQKQAKRCKIKPKLADVLHSFLMDGQPAFDAYTFEEWAKEYGYNEDSRKAESIFQECLKTGDNLRRHLSAAEIEKLRELANEM